MLDPAKQFAKCRAYVASQTTQMEGEGRQPDTIYPAITLSRQTGAGAITLGDQLAAHLNQQTTDSGCQWTVFDKNLVGQVLADHDLPAHLARFMPEDKPGLVGDAVGDMLGTHPPNWELVKRTHETIYRLARMGRCILVGRGANFVTRAMPNVLHLRLIGSLEKRVSRCMEYYGLTDAEARELIRHQDRARRRYIVANYDEEIEEPLNYHLVINVDRFRTQELVRLICDKIPGWND